MSASFAPLARPRVGLVHNERTRVLLEHAPALVEHLVVAPERLWFDFGRGAPAGRRFRVPHAALDTLQRDAEGRSLASQGQALALGDALPLDEPTIGALAAFSQRLGAFAWHGEPVQPMTAFGLPVPYGDELLSLLWPKLHTLRRRLGCPVLVENAGFVAPLAEPEMPEAAFFNALHRSGAAGLRLDLHRLYVNQQHRGADALVVLEALDPAAVREVRLSGGDRACGFYADSRSALTPFEVWDWAFEFLPRCPNLRAIAFELNASAFDAVGLAALVREFERLHELAETCHEGAAQAAPC